MREKQVGPGDFLGPSALAGREKSPSLPCNQGVGREGNRPNAASLEEETVFRARKLNRRFFVMAFMGTLWSSGLSLHPTVSAAQAPSPLFVTQAAAANRDYQGDVLTTIQTLNDFWSSSFPTVFHRQFAPLRGLRAYSPDAGVEGIPCDEDKAPAMNAFYCGQTDLIEWDEGLLLGFYEKVGDFAAAFAIAHEWGHAVQARLGIRNGQVASIQMELQADCFAGAWARYIEELGLLESGDIDEATAGLFLVKDPIGTEWLQPGAHGTGRERIIAFSQGQDEGIQRCFGAMPRRTQERSPQSQ
jgi:predicted metalloprotease